MRPPTALRLPIFLSAAMLSPGFAANWGKPPAGWDDMRFGLVNDGKAVYNARMQAAVKAGTKLDYRYTYINNGVLAQADTARNAYSWLFSPYQDYVQGSKTIGVKPAFVFYMLQEDQNPAAATLATNAQDAVFMRNYFTTLKRVAQRSAGTQPVFVLEPDTWGYALQAGMDPTTAPAKVSSLGGDFAYLSDLPDTYSGMAQAMIRTVKRFAPDGYAGVLMSHWTPDSYACEPPDGPNSQLGMPWRTPADVDCAADRNVAFANKLLCKGPDRGDFIGVEKNGHSAGYWWQLSQAKDDFSRRYYWNDDQNANWLRWCKRLGQGVDLPVLGWQISIGHMGLPNTCEPGPVSPSSGLGVESGNCAFEDTFFPYFFAHVPAFVDAGFIGFLVGKGLADDADYTHPDQDPAMGDRGWFFARLKEFDAGRPYLGKSAPVRRALANKGRKTRIASGGAVRFTPPGRVGQVDAEGRPLRPAAR